MILVSLGVSSTSPKPPRFRNVSVQRTPGNCRRSFISISWRVCFAVMLPMMMLSAWDGGAGGVYVWEKELVKQ